MTERQLDEVFAAIFGRDGGDFSAGAIRGAKSVQQHFDAVRTEEKRLKELEEELKNECKQLQNSAAAGLMRGDGSGNCCAAEKGRNQSSRDRKKAKV